MLEESSSHDRPMASEEGERHASETETSGPKSPTAFQVVRGTLGTVAMVGFSQLIAWMGNGLEDPWIQNGVTIPQSVIAIAVLIQIGAFIPAYIFQTEKYYDFTGSLTYISTISYSFAAGTVASGGTLIYQNLVVSILGLVWAVRLGYFLFNRIRRDGKDARFDEIKPYWPTFLAVWVLQGLWVTLTALAIFIVNGRPDTSNTFKPTAIVGLIVWGIGFGIEAVADHQKQVWRGKPENKGKWIEYGLWYYSRHPNYFGEITLWLGMSLACSGTYSGTQWIVLLSPIFVFFLLTKVSGVPLLEKRADEKWGGDEAYEEYKKQTSILVVLPKGFTCLGH